jgi:hypothetical protein
MRSRPRDMPDDDADEDSDLALAPTAVGESGGEAAVVLHWPQNRPVARLSLKLPFGDRRFDCCETSILAIGDWQAKLEKSSVYVQGGALLASERHLRL